MESAYFALTIALFVLWRDIQVVKVQIFYNMNDHDSIKATNLIIIKKKKQNDV